MSAALDLDGCDGPTRTKNEIYLLVSLPPVKDLNVRPSSAVQDMSAYRRFYESPPEVAHYSPDPLCRIPLCIVIQHSGQTLSGWPTGTANHFVKMVSGRRADNYYSLA